MQQFCLHYPGISFSLKNNGNTTISTSASDHVKTQFTKLLSVKEEDILLLNKQTNDVLVTGVVTSPNKTFKQRIKCWFSVNGRMVKSPLFFKAIDAALIDAQKGCIQRLFVKLNAPPKTWILTFIQKKKMQSLPITTIFLLQSSALFQLQ